MTREQKEGNQMKETDQIAAELMDWLADHHTLRPENEDATLVAIKAAIEKAYRQGGEDTTQAALNTFLPMVKQEIAARASESEPWKPISQGGKANEPHDMCINGKHCIEVGRDRQTVQVICNAHNATLGAQSADTKRLLLEARRLLNKWAARYAEADHAKKDRDDSRKCIEAIDAAMSQEKK